MADAATYKLPARFVRDWLDSADGEFFNTGNNDAVEVIRETDRTITLKAQPDAIRDLRERAEYYVMETYDEAYLRGIQNSARAVLRHLKTYAESPTDCPDCGHPSDSMAHAEAGCA